MSLSAQAIASTRQMTPVENYTVQVCGEGDREAELWRALPAHIAPARFKRNLVNLLMQKPEMLRYDPRLVYREVSKAAALGLLLDPQLGEAYIVAVRVKRGNEYRQEPQLRIGYRGLIKLARQSGEIKRIYAHEVCQNDRIVCELGVEKRLVHEPDMFGERGPVIGYYAVVHYADGEADFEPMTVSQVRAIRDRSDAWKALQAGYIKTTPWQTDEDEMAKKTVLRRLLKRVPQSPELSDAMAIENTADQPREKISQIYNPDRLQPPLSSDVINRLQEEQRIREQFGIKHSLDAFSARLQETDGTMDKLDNASQTGEDSTAQPSAPTVMASEVEQASTAATAAPDAGSHGPDAGAATSTNLIEIARENGRKAALAGLLRILPQGFHYKNRLPEKNAWCEGYDAAAHERQKALADELTMADLDAGA